MSQNGPTARLQGSRAQAEPSLAELLDPVALEARLSVARARRADAIARRSASNAGRRQPLPTHGSRRRSDAGRHRRGACRCAAAEGSGSSRTAIRCTAPALDGCPTPAGAATARGRNRTGARVRRDEGRQAEAATLCRPVSGRTRVGDGDRGCRSDRGARAGAGVALEPVCRQHRAARRLRFGHGPGRPASRHADGVSGAATAGPGAYGRGRGSFRRPLDDTLDIGTAGRGCGSGCRARVGCTRAPSDQLACADRGPVGGVDGAGRRVHAGGSGHRPGSDARDVGCPCRRVPACWRAADRTRSSAHRSIRSRGGARRWPRPGGFPPNSRWRNRSDGDSPGACISARPDTGRRVACRPSAEGSNRTRSLRPPGTGALCRACTRWARARGARSARRPPRARSGRLCAPAADRTHHSDAGASRPFHSVAEGFPRDAEPRRNRAAGRADRAAASGRGHAPRPPEPALTARFAMIREDFLRVRCFIMLHAQGSALSDVRELV